MTIGLAAMLAGTFVVPAVLLWAGHRMRRRSSGWRRAFWGALVAHVIAIPVATAAAMIPPEEWGGGDRLRGFLGLWLLLVAPAAGALRSRGARAMLLLLSPLLPLAPAAARAQVRPDTLPGADSAARRIEPVVVMAPRAPAVVGGAGAVVLSPAALPRLGSAPLLQEALREVPFVVVRQNSRGEMELATRGSDSRQVAVLLDGVPLTLGWDHRSDPSLIPLTGVQSLVVVRGLSSLLHGPNVLGGVIELGVARSGGAAAPARELAVGTGVDQYGSRVLSVVGGRTGALTLRGGGSYRRREGFSLGRGHGDSTAEDDLRTNSDLRHADGFAAVRWEGAGGRHLGATATGYRAERGVPPELHVEEPRLWRYPDQSRALIALSGGTGRVRTPLGRGSVDVSAGYNAGTVEIESFEARDYREVAGRETGDERTLTARAVATHSLSTLGELRAALTGGAVRYVERLDDDPASRYRQRLWSAATEAQWLLGRRALVTGGVAYDAADTPESGGRTPLDRIGAWGWRAGATTTAFGDGPSAPRLHASVSRRARFPALRELYSGALDRFQPNPALRPERLTGGEVGASAAGVQAVVFHHRLKDAVVRTTLPDRKFFRVNRDEMRSTGLELLAGWSSAPAADPSLGPWGRRGLSVDGAALVQRVRLYDRTAPGGARRPEHHPERRGTLDVGLPLPVGARGVAGLRYTGRQFCVHPDLGREVPLAGRGEGSVAVERVWPLARGAAAAVPLLRWLRAMVALDNVTDATVYDQCGLPQPGRTLRVGVEVR